MIAFLNRSSFCPDCCKGYNVDDAAHHSCRGRNCSSCQPTRSKRNNGGCPDFSPGKKRTIHCKDSSVISMIKIVSKPIKNQKAIKKSVFVRNFKCLKCYKGYKVNPKKPHKCYHDTSRHCHEFVEIYNHKCYIQRVEDVDDVNDDDDDEDKRLPPLMVFADIECLIEPTEQGKQLFIADLIRYVSEEDPPNVCHPFSGETCIQKFIDAMNNLTEVGDKQRDLFVLFHNL